MIQEEQALLFAKLEDAQKLAQKRPSFLGFLNENEIVLCKDRLKYQAEDTFLFWGGYEDAERKFVGFFPDYMEASSESFPICPLTFSFRDEDRLSHRDFLGAFMALGIERSVVGDILCSEGSCVTFVKREMKDYFLLNLRKIGKVGVKITDSLPQVLPNLRDFLQLSGVIASQRLDCFVGFLCKTSREKAAELIRKGMVSVNHRECLSPSERLNEQDLISVRKQGRFKIHQIGPLTSKGRLSIQCLKYI